MKLKDFKEKDIIIDGKTEHIYNIGFNESDETQLKAENYNELHKLWIDFCKENNLKQDCIDYLDLHECCWTCKKYYEEEYKLNGNIIGSCLDCVFEDLDVESFDSEEICCRNYIPL